MHLIRSLCWKPHWIGNHLSPSYHCKCQLLPNMYSITTQSHVLVRTTGFSCFWLQRSQRIAATLRFFCGASAEPWRCPRWKRGKPGQEGDEKEHENHEIGVSSRLKYERNKEIQKLKEALSWNKGIQWNSWGLRSCLRSSPFGPPWGELEPCLREGGRVRHQMVASYYCKVKFWKGILIFKPKLWNWKLVVPFLWFFQPAQIRCRNNVNGTVQVHCTGITEISMQGLQ